MLLKAPGTEGADCEPSARCHLWAPHTTPPIMSEWQSPDKPSLCPTSRPGSLAASSRGLSQKSCEVGTTTPLRRRKS